MPNNENITKELLIRLKNGDMQAFDLLYDQYCHKLFSFIHKIIKNEQEAEDIVQEVFVKIWETRTKLDDQKLVNSYIFTIAYNSSINLIRKRIVDKKYLEYLKNSSILLNAPESISEVEFNELNDRTLQLIESLPDRQKQVFLLHREKGLSYSEIAEQLGISVNTVENHMTKALRYLRENLNKNLIVNILYICIFL